MTSVEEFAPAKVNLTLHITGLDGTGYHLLDSLVVFPAIGDLVTATPAKTLCLSVDGPFAEGVPTDASNLMLKAAQFLNPQSMARLHLNKALPHPGGIGGGSSDAAATLRALSRLWDRPLPKPAATLSLGADVPVCLSRSTQRMRGIGEDVTLEPSLPPIWLVLVNPGVPCPTKAIFGRLRDKSNPPMPEIVGFDGFADFVDWLKVQRNDLEGPARAEAPIIGEVLGALAQDAAVARMSGSGGTCFGVYETQSQAELAVGRLARSDWWVKAAPVS